MIKLTSLAARQVAQAAQQGGMENMALRIAVRREANGSLQYGMGFDTERDNDLQVLSEGVTLLVSPHSQELLNGTVLDYVELAPGDFRFIFINPNDLTPPQSSTSGESGCSSSSGCGGCSSRSCG